LFANNGIIMMQIPFHDSRVVHFPRFEVGRVIPLAVFSIARAPTRMILRFSHFLAGMLESQVRLEA
jgi:hypothetical protein